MKVDVKCPCCDCSDHVHMVSVARRLGTVVGGGIGGFVGLVSHVSIGGKEVGEDLMKKLVTKFGQMKLTTIPDMSTCFTTGAAMGGKLGRQFDKNVIGKYKCKKCGNAFLKL